MRRIMLLLIMSVPCIGAGVSGVPASVVLGMIAFVMLAFVVTGRREANESAAGDGTNQGGKGGS